MSHGVTGRHLTTRTRRTPHTSRRAIRSMAKYGPVNKCIYCGETEGVLTDEHVLAANLDGDVILVKASCKKCQKEINENIEQPSLQIMFRDIRYSRGIGRRNIKNRPKTTKLVVDDGTGQRTFKEVLYSQAPTFLLLPVFNTPGIARSVHPMDRSDHFLGWWSNYNNPTKDDVYLEAKISVTLLIRLLAKIAHGAAVWTFGLDGFKPFLTNIILGIDTTDFTYFIGGDDIITPNTKEFGFDTDPFEIKIGVGKDERELVAVNIRIFANLGAPTYQVVVGKHLKNGGALQPYHRPHRRKK